MLSAVKGIDALVQAEVDAGVAEERIVVGGFSQGAELVLVLQYCESLADGRGDMQGVSSRS